MRRRPEIPDEVEDFRDTRWCREGARQIETAFDAERFIEHVGFASCMTDSRRPGPSLYVAVCGRRDAVMPRNVQTDPEASQTWALKEELVRRGHVYFATIARRRAWGRGRVRAVRRAGACAAATGRGGCRRARSAA